MFCLHYLQPKSRCIFLMHINSDLKFATWVQITPQITGFQSRLSMKLQSWMNLALSPRSVRINTVTTMMWTQEAVFDQELTVKTFINWWIKSSCHNFYCHENQFRKNNMVSTSILAPCFKDWPSCPVNCIAKETVKVAQLHAWHSSHMPINWSFSSNQSNMIGANDCNVEFSS